MWITCAWLTRSATPKKIVSNVVRVTKDVRELMMAEYCTQIIAQSPYFKDGFSLSDGRRRRAALAVNGMLKPYMQQKGGFGWALPSAASCRRCAI